jgi:hypothetical protein
VKCHYLLLDSEICWSMYPVVTNQPTGLNENKTDQCLNINLKKEIATKRVITKLIRAEWHNKFRKQSSISSGLQYVSSMVDKMWIAYSVACISWWWPVAMFFALKSMAGISSSSWLFQCRKSKATRNKTV